MAVGLPSQMLGQNVWQRCRELATRHDLGTGRTGGLQQFDIHMRAEGDDRNSCRIGHRGEEFGDRHSRSREVEQDAADVSASNRDFAVAMSSTESTRRPKA